MVTKIEGSGYKCSICDVMYDRDTEAVSCEKSHNIIYVPFERDDLFKLIQFIYVKDDSLLTPGLIKTLQKYSKGHYYG